MRSTALIGGATAGSIVIGLVRTKIFALLIGPLGIGLLGLLQAIQTTAATIAQAGLQVSGVRQVAAAENEEQAALARAAIWTLTWPLALTGGLLLWLLREPVARLVTGSSDEAGQIGLLGIAVWLTVIAASQLAVLQGYRRIGDLARARLWGAFFGAAAGIALVWWLREDGVVWALIAASLASILVAHVYGRTLPRWSWRSVRTARLAPEWSALIRLGLAITISGLVGTAAQVAARALIVRESGLDAAGLFQAAWGVSATNLTLLLGAMSADYFPRMSAVAGDPAKEAPLAEQQLAVALLIAGPLLIALSTGSEIALHLLYSSEFTGAARLLQWQLLGDALRLVGWAFAMILLARRDMLFYMAGEIGFAVVYLVLIGALQGRMGIEAAGLAYFCSYLVYSAYAAAVCGFRHGIRVAPWVYGLLATVVAWLALLLGLTFWSKPAMIAVGIAAFVLTGYWSLRRLEQLTVPGLAGRLAARLRRK